MEHKQSDQIPIPGNLTWNILCLTCYYFICLTLCGPDILQTCNKQSSFLSTAWGSCWIPFPNSSADTWNSSTLHDMYMQVSLKNKANIWSGNYMSWYKSYWFFRKKIRMNTSESKKLQYICTANSLERHECIAEEKGMRTTKHWQPLRDKTMKTMVSKRPSVF